MRGCLGGESALAIRASQLLLDDAFDIIREASVAEARQDTGRLGDELLHVVVSVENAGASVAIQAASLAQEVPQSPRAGCGKSSGTVPDADRATDSVVGVLDVLTAQFFPAFDVGSPNWRAAANKSGLLSDPGTLAGDALRRDPHHQTGRWVGHWRKARARPNVHLS